MLSDHEQPELQGAQDQAGLNAPSGARCFLTVQAGSQGEIVAAGLNAPYGAWCFLTWIATAMKRVQILSVLMHLMPLGDF